MGFYRTAFSKQWLAAALLLASPAAAGADRPRIAISDVSVVDVEHGSLAAPRTVLIADGRIVAVDAPSKVAVPANAVRVDGQYPARDVVRAA